MRPSRQQKHQNNLATLTANQPGRNTIKMMQMLQKIIEEAIEFQLNIGICFIEYPKSFDILLMKGTPKEGPTLKESDREIYYQLSYSA